MNDALPLLFNQSARELDLAVSSAKLAGMAKDSAAFRYADLFAGIGGFHAMLDHAGGRCVYVSEIDREARQTYLRNWVEPLPESRRPVVNTDITLATPDDGPVDVPAHDVLAAGFPASRSRSPATSAAWTRHEERSSGTSPASSRTARRLLSCSRTCGTSRVPVTRTSGTSSSRRCERSVTASRRHHLCSPRTSSRLAWRDAAGSGPGLHPGHLRGPQRALAEVDVPPTVVRGPVDGWNVHDWDAEWILDDDAGHREHLEVPADGRRDRLGGCLGRPRPADVGSPRRSPARLPAVGRRVDSGARPRSARAGGICPAGSRRSSIKNARFYDDHRDVIRDWKRANKRSLLPRVPSQARVAGPGHRLTVGDSHALPAVWHPSQGTDLPAALVAITQTSIMGSRRRRLTPHEAARLQGFAVPSPSAASGTRLRTSRWERRGGWRGLARLPYARRTEPKATFRSHWSRVCSELLKARPPIHCRRPRSLRKADGARRSLFVRPCWPRAGTPNP